MDNGSFFLIMLAVALYFLPWMVAASRDHKNRSAIAALNLFLGWTVLGWVISLVWALTAQEKPNG